MNKEDRLLAEGITESTKPEVKDQVSELYHLWCEGRITAASLANKAYLAGYLKRHMEGIAHPPEGETPSEAALHEMAAYKTRLEGLLGWLMEPMSGRVTDAAREKIRASLSSLPQEGQAEESAADILRDLLTWMEGQPAEKRDDVAIARVREIRRSLGAQEGAAGEGEPLPHRWAREAGDGDFAQCTRCGETAVGSYPDTPCKPQPPAPTSPAGRDHGKALAQYLIRSIPTPHTEEIEVTDELMDLIQAANGGTFDRATPEAGSPAAGESQRAEALRAEVERLKAVLNTPETQDFLRAVQIEAGHQRERWGSGHDAGKAAQDWFWLLGYLAGKAIAADKAGDREKMLHHIITTAAACANWHSAVLGGVGSAMRPSIEPPPQEGGADALT